MKNPIHSYHHSVSNSMTVGGQNVYPFGEATSQQNAAHGFINHGYRGYIGNGGRDEHFEDNPLQNNSNYEKVIKPNTGSRDGRI